MSETVPLLRGSPSPESLVRGLHERLLQHREYALLDPVTWPLMASRNGAPGPPQGPGAIPFGVRHKPPPGPSSGAVAPGGGAGGAVGHHHSKGAVGGGMAAGDPKSKSDKTVLKEAVDAVVNSFAKHTHGYGRGKLCYFFNLSRDY